MNLISVENGDIDFANLWMKLPSEKFISRLYGRNKRVSISRKLASVRTFFEFLIRNGTMKSNSAKLVPTPERREKTSRNFLTVDEVVKVGRNAWFR